MKVASYAVLLVLASLALGFSILACLIAPPNGLSSRDLLVIAIGLAGIVFSVLASRGFWRINQQLRHAAA